MLATKHRNQIIAASLLLVLNGIFLAACSSNDSIDHVSSAAVSDPEPMTTEELYLDHLPEGLDFGGETLNILIRSDEHYLTEMLVEEAQGDIVDDAVYQRNLSVMERLNYEMSYIIRDAAWGSSAQEMNKYIKQSVMADDRDFDLICGYGSLMAYLALEDCFYNILDVPYLDFKQPWWPTDYVDQMSINGKMHMLTGDALLSSVSGMAAVFFNKKVAQEFACENFYQCVMDGKWTLDKMIEITSNIYKDLNNNNTADLSDLYGMCNTALDPFIAACEEPFCLFNKDGTPYLNIVNDKITIIFNKLYDLTWKNPATYPLVDHGQGWGEYPKFENDQLLFTVTALQSVDQYRNMNTDFGILPIPKYDEIQESYYTVCADNATLFALPTTCVKTELIGAALEALSAESCRTVIPTYYEVALKVKYSRDDESCQMLDILHDGRQYNMGYMYCLPLGIEGTILRQILAENSNLTSFYKRNQKKYEKYLEKLIDYYWSES